MVQNCSFCKSKVEADFKFCGVCGKLLKKTCQKCNIKFEPTFNFCGQCGTSLEKSSVDPNFKSKSQKKTDLNQNSGIKVKVGILFGFDLSPVKQEQGGGSRRICLNQTDDYNSVLKKITELYFPRNSYTCLGHVREYRINILDFKKQILNNFSFKNLSTYVATHGLTLQIKPIFFLHLFKNENVPSTSSAVSKYSGATTANNSEINHVTKKIKKEPVDIEIIPASSSNSQSQIKHGNKKKLSESSSSSSSETDSEDEKNKLCSQKTGYESLRQRNKLENQDSNILAKKRVFKRDSSSSSSSSISSSSSTASFKKAKRLDRILNRRLQNLNNEKDPKIEKKGQNDKPLLPTPNITPSIKANLADQIKKSDDRPIPDKNDAILLIDKTKEKNENSAIENDKNDKYKYNNNYKTYSKSDYWYKNNYSYYPNSKNSNETSNYYRNNYRYNYYNKSNQYSIKRYNDRKYDNYYYKDQRENFK